jgi:hypothetical protein
MCFLWDVIPLLKFKQAISVVQIIEIPNIRKDMFPAIEAHERGGFILIIPLPESFVNIATIDDFSVHSLLRLKHFRNNIPIY